MKTFKGPVWTALINAVAVGQQMNFENAARAFHQFFDNTASGVFLDRRAARVGLTRPPGLGMSDEDFRKYLIAFSNDQITSGAFLEMLSVFYGDDTLKAHCLSGLSEPFSLKNGDDLVVEVDGDQTYIIQFFDTDVPQLSSVTALSLSMVILQKLRALGAKIICLPYFSPDTNSTKIKLSTETLGLAGSIRILGGLAQNSIQFPTYVATQATTGDLGLWTVTKPTPTTTRYTLTGATTLDLSLVEEGDYVNIVGSLFQAANRGSFTISAVSVTYPSGVLTQWFEVPNFLGVAQGGFSPKTKDSYFFHPTKVTVNNGPRTSIILTHTTVNRTDISLPATTKAVNRNPLTAAYLKTRSSAPITAAQRIGNLVTVTAFHGLTTGSQVLVDNVYADNTPPPVVAGTPSTSGNVGSTDASLQTIDSLIRASDTVSVFHHQALVLSNGDVLVMGGSNVPAIYSGTETSQSVCDRFRVTSTTTVSSGVVQYNYNWIATASMPTAKNRFNALILKDGRVMTAGGFDGTNVLQETTFYNTALNTWSVGGASTIDQHANASMVLLLDGRVLLSGGATGTGSETFNQEVYDPSTDAWNIIVPLAFQRQDHQAITLPSGQVLIMGGRTIGQLLNPSSGARILSACEVVDVGANTSTITGRMAYRRTGFSVTNLPDGRVLVIGGWGGTANGAANAALAVCEVYDPSLGQWSPAGFLKTARWNHSAILLPNNKVMVLGGTTTSNGKQSGPLNIEYLDLATFKVVAAPVPLKTSISSAVCVKTNGIVLVTGGINSSGTVASTQVLIPNSDTVGGGRLNGWFRATVLDSSHFTYKTDISGYSNTNSGLATPVAGLPASNIVPGPYSFDPKHGLAITGTFTSLTVDVPANSYPQYLTVANANLIPNAPGQLVLSFGFETQTIVAYLGRLDATRIILDPSATFPSTLLAGTDVTWLSARGVHVPKNASSLGSFYLTNPAVGRVAAIAALNRIIAAGMNLDTNIIYPGDRGLSGEGLVAEGDDKLSDKVYVWGGDQLDEEIQTARED